VQPVPYWERIELLGFQVLTEPIVGRTEPTDSIIEPFSQALYNTKMMEPPSYKPARKSNSGLIIGLIIGGVCLCCGFVGLVVGGGFWAFRKISGTAGCVFTFGDMKRAMQSYEMAHNGKLPKADTWQDDMREYYRKAMTPKEQMGPFPQTSPDGDWGCKESDGTMTGMAFNTDYSGKEVSKIKDSDNAVVIFETTRPSKNQHSKYVRVDPHDSPKIFGAPRGWFFITASGEVFTDSPRKGIVRMNGPGGGIQVRSGNDQ